MRKREFPSYDVLASRLSYNPDTGQLTWMPRPESDFASASEWKRWNTVKPGTIAGSKMFTTRGSKSHLAVSIDGHPFSAHRIVWAMSHGPISRSEWIDHINGDPWDNRLCNLRLTNNTKNQWNRVAPKNNTSGVKGVTWCARMESWKSSVRASGKYFHAGYHKTKGLAASSVAKMSLHLHGKHSPYYRKSAQADA